MHVGVYWVPGAPLCHVRTPGKCLCVHLHIYLNTETHQDRERTKLACPAFSSACVRFVSPVTDRQRQVQRTNVLWLVKKKKKNQKHIAEDSGCGNDLSFSLNVLPFLLPCCLLSPSSSPVSPHILLMPRQDRLILVSFKVERQQSATAGNQAATVILAIFLF